jgi:hypothetical protein
MGDSLAVAERNGCMGGGAARGEVCSGGTSASASAVSAGNGRGRGGRGGRSGSYRSALWTDYGLRSVSTGCRRCRVGRVWQSERRSGQRAGDALECPAGRAGEWECRRTGRQQRCGPGCLSCACERRAKCQCLCLEGALSYERTATGSCREPALESQTSDLTRRDHDAELRAGPGSEPQPQLTLIHRSSAHTSADTTTTTISASTTTTTSEAPPPPPQAPPQQPLPPPHPPWPPRRPCP